MCQTIAQAESTRQPIEIRINQITDIKIEPNRNEKRNNIYKLFPL